MLKILIIGLVMKSGFNIYTLISLADLNLMMPPMKQTTLPYCEEWLQSFSLYSLNIVPQQDNSVYPPTS